MKKTVLKRFQKNIFLKRVSMLIGGTAISQAIALLSLPLLTRLYNPESFSSLAIYSSTLSLITVVACLRFEIAIPLPKSNRIAVALLFISLISVFSFSLLSALTVWLYPDIINNITNNQINELLWLIPFGIFIVGTYNAFQYWHSREKNFKLIAKTRVTQSLSGTSIKIGSGYFTNEWITGLIVGQILSQGSGFIILSKYFLKETWKTLKKIKLKQLLLAFSRYKKFPQYSTLEAISNTGSVQIPIILIAHFSISTEVGYLMIAMQLLSAPVNLIGSSVAQVYLSEGAENKHKGNLQSFTHKTIQNLFKIALFPAIIIAISASYITPLLLGEEWRRAGVLIIWMVPWFFMQFITSPVSMALHITGNQKIALFLQTAGLALRVSMVYLSLLFYPQNAAQVYAASGFLFYSLYLFILLKKLK